MVLPTKLALMLEKVSATETIPALKENFKTTPMFGIEFVWVVKQIGPEFEKHIDKEGGLFDLYCNIKSVFLGHGIFTNIQLRKSDYTLLLFLSEEPKPYRKITRNDCLDDWMEFLIGKEIWESMSQQPRF